MSLSLSIHPDNWDFTKNEPKPKCPNKDLITKIILDKKTEYQKLNLEQKDYTAASLVGNKAKQYKSLNAKQLAEGLRRAVQGDNEYKWFIN